MNDFAERFAELNILLIVEYSFTIVLLTSGMIWYGSRLLKQLKITSLIHSNQQNEEKNNNENNENLKKIEIILRINMVYMGCNICYFVRVVALGVLCFYLILDKPFHIGVLTWFILSNWIPTIIPVSLSNNQEKRKY